MCTRWHLMVLLLLGRRPPAPPRVGARLVHVLADDGTPTPLGAAGSSRGPAVRISVPAGYVLRNEAGLRVGQSHPLAKLSEAQADEAQAMHAAGHSYKVIARSFGVSKSCIAGILQGRRRTQAIARMERQG